MKLGRYYLSRVIKLGQLNQTRLMDAIAKAPTVRIGEFNWTITDVTDHRDMPSPYLFGKLTKYSPEGTVRLVEEPAKQQVEAVASNLLAASAPFIYLPNFSGLAFLPVSNGIKHHEFPRRFKAIVEAAHDNFFVDCTIEPVADYRTFLNKICSMSKITELSASVHPPNPLFGRLWASLPNYLRQRKASNVSIKETAQSGEGLSTDIRQLMEGISENPKYEPESAPSITDLAILMAVDGYGQGKVVGLEKNAEVVARTRDSQKSFSFEKAPLPENLAKVSKEQFERISDERDMRH